MALLMPGFLLIRLFLIFILTISTTWGTIFISPAAVATIMFGNYLNRDIFNNYTPSFLKILNKNAVIGSEKAIKCDVLQNFAVNIEGGDDKVRSVIKGISWDAINLMMGK